MANAIVRMIGVVEWFCNFQGYGRIMGEDGKRYNVHFSQIATYGCGFRSLNVGEVVEFTPAKANDPRYIDQAHDVKRELVLEKLSGKAEARFEKTPKSFKGVVDEAGAILFPQLTSFAHPRDYRSGDVFAYYLGNPGYIFTTEKVLVEVDLPSKAFNGGLAVVATDKSGGIIPRRFIYDFMLGSYMLVVMLEGNQAYAEVKAIGMRSQGSKWVIDDRDKGLWFTIESILKITLSLPETEYKKELTAAIRDQIPDPENLYQKKPAASLKTFASAIARCVTELRHVETQTQAQSATA